MRGFRLSPGLVLRLIITVFLGKINVLPSFEGNCIGRLFLKNQNGFKIFRISKDKIFEYLVPGISPFVLSNDGFIGFSYHLLANFGKVFWYFKYFHFGFYRNYFYRFLSAVVSNRVKCHNINFSFWLILLFTYIMFSL